MTPPASADIRVAESLLAFWAEGGVDSMLLETPQDRIAAGQVAVPARPARAPVALAERQAPSTKPEPNTAAAVAKAREMAAAAQDLVALSGAIAEFDGCPLRFEGAATRAVVYRGAVNAPVMVIGEGPGADEDAQGQPFVGRAGKLLDKMLSAAGVADQVLITNTVFWRPLGNRTPTHAEQSVCAPFLERMIALVQPKMLLLVGGASAKSLLNEDQGILALRGRWFTWRGSDGALELPALPTLHPAFLLRQPAAKKKAWVDLLALTKRLDPISAPD